MIIGNIYIYVGDKFRHIKANEFQTKLVILKFANV